MQAWPAPPRMKTGRRGIFVGIGWNVEIISVVTDIEQVLNEKKPFILH
jgi:hypothetical protein